MSHPVYSPNSRAQGADGDQLAELDSRRRAWVLNLDAELELRAPLRYQPTKSTLAACRHFDPLARSLLGPNDIVLDRSQAIAKGTATGYLGAAWCLTPSVLDVLARAGAEFPPAPSLECLQRVSHRRFHASLGQVLPDAGFASSLDEARELLSRPSAQGWMVKRGYSFSGRGNRRFPGAPTADDWRWLEHAFHDGGVQIEPRVSILDEYSLHGEITLDGALLLGTPCLLQTTEVARYTHVNPQTLTSAEVTTLRQAATRAAKALHADGYFGPFGIDAFHYEWQDERHFNPRSEVNARYTLAYPTGMLGR